MWQNTPKMVYDTLIATTHAPYTLDSYHYYQNIEHIRLMVEHAIANKKPPREAVETNEVEIYLRVKRIPLRSRLPIESTAFTASSTN